MKKITKLIVTVTALTVLFAMPVLATEKSASAEKSMLDKHSSSVEAAVNDLAKTQIGGGAAEAFKVHEKTVMKQVVAYDNSEYDNYILYLQRVVVNDQETVRVKQQNVNSITDVCKVNPGFAPQLEAAQKELAAAQAQMAAEIAKQNKASVNAAIAAGTLKK